MNVNCPNSQVIENNVLEILKENFLSEIQFSCWTGTDRCTLLTRQLEVEDFGEDLFEKIQKLKTHSFITKEQQRFSTELLQRLEEGQVFVKLDFSENYGFVVQDATQEFHFNNDQSTLFFVIFHWKEGTQLQHKSIIFSSESRKHDTAAVYTIQNLLIPNMQSFIKTPIKKIFYFLDGAKQHFKNRYQAMNLINHKLDFGIEAEWHYYTTAHGKNEIDGIAANYKRGATKASLTAKPGDDILTPKICTNDHKTGFEVRISFTIVNKITKGLKGN